METSNYNVPFMATQPSLLIKEEIKARGMSQKELAERMGMKCSNVSRLLKGENITVQIAQKLERALDIPSSFWLNMQSNYDKDVKLIEERNGKENEAYNIERMLSSMINLTELYRRLHINTSLFIQEKLCILKNMIGFDAIEIAKMQFINNHCYKKIDKYLVDELNQNTWLTLAYINAKNNIPSNDFIKGNAEKAAREISLLAHNGGIREENIKDVLNKYGITYCVVEKLEKTPIDAACMVVEKHPSIIVTHRRNDMSMLIFNVLHELGHIEYHIDMGGDSMFVSGEAYSCDSKEEKEANGFAEDMLIDKVIWKKMMGTSINGISTKNIVNKLRDLSNEYHLDFNIIVWRYKYESHDYNLYGVKSVPIK